MRGKELVQDTYNPDNFAREGSAPNRLKQTLFGKNAIQTLDRESHRHRKGLEIILSSKANDKTLLLTAEGLLLFK